MELTLPPDNNKDLGKSDLTLSTSASAGGPVNHV